jgi:hypothetical protein
MCLDKSAHGLVPQHEIFQKPFKVDIQYDTVPTPNEYRNRGLKPGEPLKVWHVQTKGFATHELQPGVVSMGDGFADSPDAEVISGGVNHKSPTAVAIGRHGPFFLWGFSAAPKDLTESGRLALLNSVVYAAKFDHAPLLVRLEKSSRDRVPWMIGFVASQKENYAAQVEFIKKHNQELAALREKAKTEPDSLTAREKQMLKRKDLPEPSYEEYSRDQISRSFPAEVVQRCGDDAAKYTAWYEENRPYLFAQRRFWAEVDEEAKALGIPNYDPKLLDACVTALERGQDTDRAARLLKRYTGETFAKPAEWRAWLSASRPDLFFSDVGGYRFFHKAGPDAAHRRAVLARTLDEPTEKSPVSLAAVVRPASSPVGETVTIAVRMKIAPGWHAYAEAAPGETAALTRLRETLPEGVQAEGPWRMPETEPERNGGATYTGDLVFLRTFRLEAAKPGAVEIPITVSFQVCNQERCLPPESVKLTPRVEVTPKPSPRRGAP